MTMNFHLGNQKERKTIEKKTLCDYNCMATIRIFHFIKLKYYFPIDVEAKEMVCYGKEHVNHYNYPSSNWTKCNCVRQSNVMNDNFTADFEQIQIENWTSQRINMINRMYLTSNVSIYGHPNLLSSLEHSSFFSFLSCFALIFFQRALYDFTLLQQVNSPLYFSFLLLLLSAI